MISLPFLLVEEYSLSVSGENVKEYGFDAVVVRGPRRRARQVAHQHVQKHGRHARAPVRADHACINK